MAQWNELTDLTGDRPFLVTAVRLEDSDIAINGEFELPPLAGLRYEDQVFVGVSPASILCINRQNGKLLDVYQFSNDIHVCLHGLKVLAAEG